MADERVREALRAEAADAPDAGDLWDRTQRRVRRRRQQRWGSGLVAAVVLVGGLGVTLDGLQFGSPGIVLTPADAPEDGQGGEEGAQDPATAHDPDEWEDLDLGNAKVSVPAAWDVVEAAPASGPDGVPGHCPLPDDRGVVLVGGNPETCPDQSAPAGLVVATDTLVLQEAVQTLVEAHADEVDGTPGHARGWLDGHEEVGEVPAVHLGEPGMLVPGVGLVRTHAGDRADEVDRVLSTLRRTDADAAHATVVAKHWPEGRADGSEPLPLELWAFDPEGGLHRWYETEARDPGEGGLLSWPAGTAERFGAVLRVDGQARVVAGRPDEGGRELYVFPDPGMTVPEAGAWSPEGEAVVWIDREADPPAATLAVWEDAGALADGDDPIAEERVAVEGAVHPEEGHEGGPGSLRWDDDVLRDDNWGLAAPVDRHDDGRPTLADPLRFAPTD